MKIHFLFGAREATGRCTHASVFASLLGMGQSDWDCPERASTLQRCSSSKIRAAAVCISSRCVQAADFLDDQGSLVELCKHTATWLFEGSKDESEANLQHDCKLLRRRAYVYGTDRSAKLVLSEDQEQVRFGFSSHHRLLSASAAASEKVHRLLY